MGRAEQQQRAKEGPPVFVFNLNPPQRRRWGYSSPMRILRAILLGQVPVVTNKFGDHEIESLALVWDGQIETAQKMWVNATIGRRDLIRRHQAALIEYNRIAHAKNAAVDHALDMLG